MGKHKDKGKAKQALTTQLVQLQGEIAVVVGRLSDVASGLMALADVDAVSTVKRHSDELVATLDTYAASVAERTRRCTTGMDDAVTFTRAQAEDLVATVRTATTELMAQVERDVEAFRNELADLRQQAEDTAAEVIAAAATLPDRLALASASGSPVDDGHDGSPAPAMHWVPADDEPLDADTSDDGVLTTDDHPGASDDDADPHDDTETGPHDPAEDLAPVDTPSAPSVDDPFLVELSAPASHREHPNGASVERSTSSTRARPVAMSVGAPVLCASVAAIVADASDGLLAASVVQSMRDGVRGSSLRLTIWNGNEWFEWLEIPVSAERPEPHSVVVSIADLSIAIDALQYGIEHTDIVVQVGDELTIDTTLCLSRESDHLPLGAIDFIERVELGRLESGGAIATQIGRISVPSRVTSLLRARGAESIDLVRVGGRPCLRSSVDGPTVGVVATIAAPVGTDDDTIEPDRRVDGGSPVAQLLGSLSPTSSPADLEAIVRTGVVYARRVAAAHPNLPPALISEVVLEGTEAMRAAAAANPSIPDDVRDLAAGDISPVVRGAIAGNRSTDLGRLTRLSLDSEAHVRMRVGSNLATNAALLAHLSKDPDSSVRAAVGANPSADRETLEALTSDPDVAVCTAVAQNPRCPPSALEELVAIVPATVMANPRTPPAVLSAGSRVPDQALRLAVAGNPATPTKRLEALTRAEDADVLQALADNPSTPQHARRRALRRLADTTRA